MKSKSAFVTIIGWIWIFIHSSELFNVFITWSEASSGLGNQLAQEENEFLQIVAQIGIGNLILVFACYKFMGLIASIFMIRRHDWARKVNIIQLRIYTFFMSLGVLGAIIFGGFMLFTVGAKLFEDKRMILVIAVACLIGFVLFMFWFIPIWIMRKLNSKEVIREFTEPDTHQNQHNSGTFLRPEKTHKPKFIKRLGITWIVFHIVAILVLVARILSSTDLDMMYFMVEEEGAPFDQFILYVGLENMTYFLIIYQFIGLVASYFMLKKENWARWISIIQQTLITSFLLAQAMLHTVIMTEDGFYENDLIGFSIFIHLIHFFMVLFPIWTIKKLLSPSIVEQFRA